MAMGDQSSTPSIEAWAGIECTVNRVGDQYFDQLIRTGHHDRIADLDLVASLGVTRVRYPVLWERVAPELAMEPAWAWTDLRLERLRQLGVAPIATLLHHGSGPSYTSLVDSDFSAHLARFAAAVAQRYPWIDAYTPINEPLTTARFSGLYGHWYPHGRDEATFLRCVLAECKATSLAMRAIRKVNPRAKLIQTEDLGYTHATRKLAYQAWFENERRWLSLDLLCGRIDRQHPIRAHLLANGVSVEELAWFVHNPCSPDVLGFNYYVTSERYLDEDLASWPAWSHGGNGRHRYADVHAVLAGQLAGVDQLLAEAWERFGRPVAITEAHMGCTREQQLRWIVDIYDRVLAARESGIEVVALTAWSVFGAYDWHCLVTRCDGAYESGLYDVRGPTPRATALAHAWRAIAAGRRPDHAVIEGRGWWQVFGAAEGEVAA